MQYTCMVHFYWGHQAVTEHPAKMSFLLPAVADGRVLLYVFPPVHYFVCHLTTF